MAPVAYGLWQIAAQLRSASPRRPNRDRFVLSAGRASMLLYALLHLTKTQAVNAEYETLGRPSVTLDDIKSFRQLSSACPGHPEYHLTSGAEATTGPLGQGRGDERRLGDGGTLARAPFLTSQDLTSSTATRYAATAA
jgi:transketolase